MNLATYLDFGALAFSEGDADLDFLTAAGVLAFLPATGDLALALTGDLGFLTVGGDLHSFLVLDLDAVDDLDRDLR